MRILLTNDDGVYAPGLRALRTELKKVGTVTVVAPTGEQSAVGHSITLLTPLTDPGTKLAIFARGHYEYSIEPNDYLDMTRDFMRSSHTTGFEVYKVRYRASGAYQLFAKHSYRGDDGRIAVIDNVHIPHVDASNFWAFARLML